MEVDAEIHLLGQTEERLPMVVDEAGQPDAVVTSREEHALVAQRRGSAQLRHRRVDVPERHHGQRDQPARIGRAELDQPVVVRPYALHGELGRQSFQEHVALEPEDVRVEQLVVDADLVEVLGGGAAGRPPPAAPRPNGAGATAGTPAMPPGRRRPRRRASCRRCTRFPPAAARGTARGARGRPTSSRRVWSRGPGAR